MSQLTDLKAEFRVALEHQRLLDRGIVNEEAHEYHVFDFKAKVLALSECFGSGSAPDSLLHRSIELRAPRLALRGIDQIGQYFNDLSLLKDKKKINIIIDPDLIIINDEKAFATLHLISPETKTIKCIMIVTKEVNELMAFEKHHLEDRIQSVETCFDLKEILLSFPLPHSSSSSSKKEYAATDCRQQKKKKKKDANVGKAPGHLNHSCNEIPALSGFHTTLTTAATSSSPLSPWSDNSPIELLTPKKDDVGQAVCSPCLEDFDKGGFLFDYRYAPIMDSCQSDEEPPCNFLWIGEIEVGETEAL